MHLLVCNWSRPLAAIAIVVLAAAPIAAADIPPAEGLLRYVNILLGTDSDDKFSHGNTLPLVGTPWAMTDWSPQNCGSGHNTRWYFRYSEHKILGFRATHQASPWMGDYGNFMILPETGPLVVGAEDRAADYNLASSVLRPDYLRIALPRYGVTVELTASERCGVFRIAYDGAREGRRADRSGGRVVGRNRGATIPGIHQGACQHDAAGR